MEEVFILNKGIPNKKEGVSFQKQKFFFNLRYDF